MNEYLFRLALVVNTSHSKFIDNLTNIIIYALYVSNIENKEIHICELKNTIEELSGLEFTEKEINQAQISFPSDQSRDMGAGRSHICFWNKK